MWLPHVFEVSTLRFCPCSAFVVVLFAMDYIYPTGMKDEHPPIYLKPTSPTACLFTPTTHTTSPGITAGVHTNRLRGTNRGRLGYPRYDVLPDMFILYAHL